MGLLITNSYIFVLAVVLAILEVQIEGKDGWAKNLPTWRPSESSWVASFFSRFMFQKKLTGYHLAMFTFVLLIFHIPYVFGAPITFINWAKTLSFYILFISLWDFLWFLFNPHYLFKNFKKKYISWHKLWFLGLPYEYWLSIILSFLILVPFVFSQGSSILQWWFMNFILFLLQLFVVYFFMTFVFRSNT